MGNGTESMYAYCRQRERLQGILSNTLSSFFYGLRCLTVGNKPFGRWYNTLFGQENN